MLALHANTIAMPSSKTLIAFSLCPERQWLGFGRRAIAHTAATGRAAAPSPSLRHRARDRHPRPKSFARKPHPRCGQRPYGQWRGPATNPGELPDHAKLVALLQSLGLKADSHAVVVSNGKDATTDFGAMARVYWTLKSLGLKELSIVNSGMQAWNAASCRCLRSPSKWRPAATRPRSMPRHGCPPAKMCSKASTEQ